MTDDSIVVSPGPRFRTAMVLAILADALQVVVFPLFVAGAASPADDILDFATGTVMVHLLGWHWESAVVSWQTGARSRLGSVLDHGGRQCLSEVEADCGRRRRDSGADSGAERPIAFLARRPRTLLLVSNLRGWLKCSSLVGVRMSEQRSNSLGRIFDNSLRVKSRQWSYAARRFDSTGNPAFCHAWSPP